MKESEVIRINKPIILKYENRKINLPDNLRTKINDFWNKAISENPKLFNGNCYAVEKVEEDKNKIQMLVVKSDYAHYLYDERIGIKEEKYKCVAPFSGILLVTTDDYYVIGEMDKTTSVPYCLQLSGGGIDEKDIINGEISIYNNLKRELKEEMNLNLDNINYEIKYLEIPNENRHVYGFLAVGNINMTMLELKEHFNKYSEYLIENNLEVEFYKLIYLHKDTALEELDNLDNQKRPYLRNLIRNVTEENSKWMK